jgi:predicted dehydrogenase
MSHNTNRRDFLKTSAMAGAGFWMAGTGEGQESKLANEQINFASIGVGGKGQSDSGDAGNAGNMVAICDIDDKTLDKAAQKYPNAKKYNDFRKMLDEMGKSIDAVTVSTPDHCHAAASAMAMRMGKHCFTQKPLTHTIYEARKLGEIAREMKVATQMGNQGTAASGLRRSAAMIRKGCIGKVKEVHVWTNRPIWPQGGERAPEMTPPEHIHWDLFLGPAPERPYAAGYHPFAWRGWWDFGTGALGDMACHTVNMPFMALDLRNPTSVEAETSGHNKDSYPKWSIIRFEFPANDNRPALTMFWYDGGKKVDRELMPDEFLQKNKDDGSLKLSGSGCLLIGDKGKLFSPDDYGAKYLMHGDYSEPEVEITESPGHFAEYVRAIRTNNAEPAMSNFADYAGPLTETILLGNLAVWAGKKIEWDAKNLKATNAPEVDSIIKTTYREGYTL